MLSFPAKASSRVVKGFFKSLSGTVDNYMFSFLERLSLHNVKMSLGVIEALVECHRKRYKPFSISLINCTISCEGLKEYGDEGDIPDVEELIIEDVLKRVKKFVSVRYQQCLERPELEKFRGALEKYDSHPVFMSFN